MKVLVIPDPTRTRAWPGHEDAPELVGLPLGEALTRTHQSDAHFAAYHAPARHRRLSGKDPSGHAVWTLGEVPRMGLLVVDIDHTETHELNKRRKAAGQSKVAAPDAWRELERAKVDALRAAHPGVVMYETRGGYRLVARLVEDRAICDEGAKRAWRCWYLRQLGYLSRAFGIVGDPACGDWQHLYRLPRATRDRARGPEDLHIVGDLCDVGAWERVDDDAADVAEVSRLAESHGERWSSSEHFLTPPAAPRARGPRTPRSRIADAKVAPLVLVGPLAAALAAAVDALPRGVGARHHARLAIVAALRAAGWSQGLLERLVREIATALGKDPVAVVSETVPSTIALVDRDERARGAGYLREHAPAVWSVLSQHIEGMDRASIIARALHARGIPELVTRDQAAVMLREVYDRARRAGALVQVQCTAGAGKTHAAVEDAAARVREGFRTAILAPSHAVAREVLAALAARGVAAHHLVSVASHEVDGVRSCAYHEAAAALGAGGVSAVPVLCDGRGYGAHRPSQRSLPIVDAAGRDAPCEHRDGCAAYAAARETIPDDVLVVVGVHQHARTAHRWLHEGGAGGLLVVDEAPLLLDTARWSGAELLHLAGLVRGASVCVSTERWRAEVLVAAAHGLRAAPEAVTLREVLVAGLVVQGIPEADARGAVAGWAERVRFEDDGRERRSLTPRPSQKAVYAARRSGGAHALRDPARALRACGLLARALAHENGHEDRAIVSVALRDYGADAGAHELRVGAIVEPLAGALCDPTIGRVLLDATGDPALVERYTGRVDVVRVDVADPCEVTRTFIPWSHGTRRHVLDRVSGCVRWDEAAAPMLEALTLACERVPRGGSVAVLSYQAVVTELRRAWEHPEDAHPKAARILAVLRERGIAPAWGYYGALRGRNDWKACDAVVTLGTPYPPVAEVEQLADAHELRGAVRDLLEQAARDELEQAVARVLRGQRTEGVSLVVLASHPPRRADARWTVRALSVGRPAKVDAHELVTLAERLGIEGAATVANVSPRTVQRARASGDPTPPPGGVTDPVADTERGGGPLADCVTPPGGDPPTLRGTGCGSCARSSLGPVDGAGGVLDRAGGVVAARIRGPSWRAGTG